MKWLLDKLTYLFAVFINDGMADEYFDKYMAPVIHELVVIVRDYPSVSKLVKLAINTPDPTIIGQSPSARLRTMLDMIKSGETVQSVITYYDR